jgi:uncharacterized RDD family membrane protein YckC
MTAAVPPRTPSVRRRLAAFVYEGVLLFGVVMTAGFVWSLATQQRHALLGRHGLQVLLFLVLGLYFTWFWSHGGQTVAMKAWRIRLVASGGRPVSPARAAVRYLLAWLWFVPQLLAIWVADLRGAVAVTGVLTAGVLAFAALAWLHPSRQFLHDVLCGTRLIDTRS